MKFKNIIIGLLIAVFGFTFFVPIALPDDVQDALDAATEVSAGNDGWSVTDIETTGTSTSWLDDQVNNTDVSSVGTGGGITDADIQGDGSTVDENANVIDGYTATDAGVTEYAYKAICDRVNDNADKVYGSYPPCAATPADCGTKHDEGPYHEPVNCMFLEEPIGGDPGFDLYKISCFASQEDSERVICEYILWYGEAIVGNDHGPVQAILAYTPGKEHEAAFGPLMAYTKLAYDFLSGIIVAFVILIIIIGGIRMTISHGNSEEFGKGKDMITKAIIGMALWFLASLILYSINPTFYSL